MKHDPLQKVKIPTERVKPLVQELVDSMHYTEYNGVPAGGYGRVSRLSGIPPRQLYSILKNDYLNVTFDVLDKILTRCDMLELWYTPPEEGGFSDYYCDDPAGRAVQGFARTLLIRASGTKCIDCGEACHKYAHRCRDCDLRLRTKKSHLCSLCEENEVSSGSNICRPCYNKAGRSLREASLRMHERTGKRLFEQKKT